MGAQIQKPCKSWRHGEGHGGREEDEGERKSGSEGSVRLELDWRQSCIFGGQGERAGLGSLLLLTHTEFVHAYRGRHIPTVPFLTNKQAHDAHLFIVCRVTRNALAYTPRRAAIPLHSKYLCTSLVLTRTHTGKHPVRQHPLGWCSSDGDREAGTQGRLWERDSVVRSCAD